MSSASIDLINQALARIGAAPLQSASDPNGQAYIAIRDAAIGSLCSQYPWTFTTGFQQLARLAAPPVETHWQYAYALPSDMAGTPLAVFDTITQNSPWAGAGLPTTDFTFAPADQPQTDFEIWDGALYANLPQLWMRYTKQPNPLLWPAYFTELATKLLMAELAIPAREDAVLRNTLLEEIFGPPQHQGEAGMIAMCKAIDAKGKPSRRIQIGVNPLATVRWT